MDGEDVRRDVVAQHDDNENKVRVMALIHKVFTALGIFIFLLFWIMGFVSSSGNAVIGLYKLDFFIMLVTLVYTVFFIVIAIVTWCNIKKNMIWYICFAMLRLFVVIALVIVSAILKTTAMGEILACA